MSIRVQYFYIVGKEGLDVNIKAIRLEMSCFSSRNYYSTIVNDGDRVDAEQTVVIGWGVINVKSAQDVNYYHVN